MVTKANWLPSNLDVKSEKASGFLVLINLVEPVHRVMPLWKSYSRNGIQTPQTGANYFLPRPTFSLQGSASQSEPSKTLKPRHVPGGIWVEINFGWREWEG